MKFLNRNVYVSEKAEIGENVRIGNNTCIYDNVQLGDGSVIGDNCIIGEPKQDYYHDEKYENPITKIGQNAMLRSGTTIYASCMIGSNFSTGHNVTIREFTKIGENCKVGTISDIQGYVEIGDYCQLHSNVHIGQKAKLGSFIFVYPYVVFTNDPTPPSRPLMGVTVGDFSQISVSCVLLPGISIGEHCIVGANSTVGKDVGDFELVLGSPAKFVKDVREIKSKTTGERHYPWPYRFSEGMPWEGIGFDQWLRQER